jgi:hypothetical protein
VVQVEWEGWEWVAWVAWVVCLVLVLVLVLALVLALVLVLQEQYRVLLVLHQLHLEWQALVKLLSHSLLGVCKLHSFSHPQRRCSCCPTTT